MMIQEKMLANTFKLKKKRKELQDRIRTINLRLLGAFAAMKLVQQLKKVFGLVLVFKP